MPVSHLQPIFTHVHSVTGILSTMFALGPFCGNLLSAVTLKLPENIAAAGTLKAFHRDL